MNVNPLLPILKFLNLLNLLSGLFIVCRCSAILLKPTNESVNAIVVEMMETVPLGSDFDQLIVYVGFAKNVPQESLLR